MERTVQDVIDEMNEEQQAAVYSLLGSALGIDGENGDDVEHSDINELNIKSIFEDGIKYGSLKDSILKHAETYGIKEIETLFPEPKLLNNPPGILNNEIGWVSTVLNGVHKSPFARIKSQYVDLRDDAIRARGYLKTNLKKEHVFELLKRTTGPTTIYTKQKIDRDDVIDITDFNVVSLIKQELRLKLDEEIARVILIGDGRSNVDNDKIDEECIRPIYNDADLYTVKIDITGTGDINDEIINEVIKNRKKYKGSGSPTLFTTEDVVSGFLLLKDNNGRRIYSSIGEIATLLRVNNIVTVPHMEGLVRTDSTGKKYNVYGIIVNLRDYSVGTNAGGQVSMFDDFDIDYNQQKYLLETRLSGALTVPFSAMVIEKAQ